MHRKVQKIVQACIDFGKLLYFCGVQVLLRKDGESVHKHRLVGIFYARQRLPYMAVCQPRDTVVMAVSVLTYKT